MLGVSNTNVHTVAIVSAPPHTLNILLGSLRAMWNRKSQQRRKKANRILVSCVVAMRKTLWGALYVIANFWRDAKVRVESRGRGGGHGTFHVPKSNSRWGNVQSGW